MVYPNQLLTSIAKLSGSGKKRFAEPLGEYVAKPPEKLALGPEYDPRPPVDLCNSPNQEFSVLSDLGGEK